MMPTKEQIQWFWEQCPVVKDESNIMFAHGYPCYDSLDDLFKHAVPTVLTLMGTKAFDRKAFFEMWLNSWEDSSEDPALSLFRAIYKAFGGEEEEPDLYAEVLAEDYGSGGNSEE